MYEIRATKDRLIVGDIILLAQASTEDELLLANMNMLTRWVYDSDSDSYITQEEAAEWLFNLPIVELQDMIGKINEQLGEEDKLSKLLRGFGTEVKEVRNE